MPKLIKGFTPLQALTVHSDHLVLSRLPNGLFTIRHRAIARNSTSIGNNPAILFELQDLIDCMVDALKEEQQTHAHDSRQAGPAPEQGADSPDAAGA